MAVLAFRERTRLLELVRRPPAPLAAIGALAFAHVLSALLAPDGSAGSAKFSLRMVAMAACAALVAAAPAGARRASLVALAATTALVAGLALVEGFGGRRLDPFLDLFRESAFNVGGVRRATGGSEYPNQAAAFMMCGLLVMAGLAGRAVAVWSSAPGSCSRRACC